MSNEELVYLYQQGNKEALEKLIEKNKGIVYKLVNKFYTEGTNSIDREDLEQEGYIGLITAANRYKIDMDKPCKFITYAVYWIYSKIHRFIRCRNTNDEVSLNVPKFDEDDTELIDHIKDVDYSFENVEEKIYIKQLRQELEDVMRECNSLNEREVVQFHYGWDGTCMTLAEIGELLGFNAERVRLIENKALRKIRQSKWARQNAREIYIQKKSQSVYSITGTEECISFAQRYLYNEVM